MRSPTGITRPSCPITRACPGSFAPSREPATKAERRKRSSRTSRPLARARSARPAGPGSVPRRGRRVHPWACCTSPICGRPGPRARSPSGSRASRRRPDASPRAAARPSSARVPDEPDVGAAAARAAARCGASRSSPPAGRTSRSASPPLRSSGGIGRVAGLDPLRPAARRARRATSWRLRVGTDARRDGRSSSTAHLDTHPTAGRTAAPAAPLVAAASGAGSRRSPAVVATRPGVAAWRQRRRARRGRSRVHDGRGSQRVSCATPAEAPDDNTSGLLALVRFAELVADGSPTHDVWIVATGRRNVRQLRSRRRSSVRIRTLRDAWLIEIDALGTGEVVASPCAAAVPLPGTPHAAGPRRSSPLRARPATRSRSGACGGPHSDARAALRHARSGDHAHRRVCARRPVEPGPDPANAERAARIVDSLRARDVYDAIGRRATDSRRRAGAPSSAARAAGAPL